MEHGTFAELIARVIGIINAIIPLLAGLALLGFMYNMFLLIWQTNHGHAQDAERRTMIIWNLIALFVLFSIWGILRILLHTFFPNDFQSGGGGVHFGDTSYF